MKAGGFGDRQTNGQMNGQTDISECRVAFALQRKKQLSDLLKSKVITVDENEMSKLAVIVNTTEHKFNFVN